MIAGLPISKQTALAIRQAAADVGPSAKAKKWPGEGDAKVRVTKLERVLESATREAVNVRLVHRKGAFRVMLDVPLELADRISVKK